MIATARATWSGTWRDGQGTLATGGPTVPPTPYTYASRFDGAPGAVPEELLAAAFGGCLNQASANVLGWGNFAAEAVDTRVEVEVRLGVHDGPPGEIRAHVRAVVPVIRPDQFASLVTVAVQGCMMSRLLRTTPAVTAELVDRIS